MPSVLCVSMNRAANYWSSVPRHPNFPGFEGDMCMHGLPGLLSGYAKGNYLVGVCYCTVVEEYDKTNTKTEARTHRINLNLNGIRRKEANSGYYIRRGCVRMLLSV